ANEGDYRVIISNTAGSITSFVARVSVFTGTVAQAMVAHLRFDGNYSDSSGHGNNAKPVGSPTFSPGKNGQALHVKTTTDGSINNYASLGFPPELRFDTNDFSVGLWVNYSASTDDQPLITDKDWGSSSNIGWGIYSQGGGNFRVVATGTPRGSGNKMDTTLSNIIRDGTWHHVMVSFWRGRLANTYVDGALVNSTALTITGSVDTFDQNFNINIGQDGTGVYTDGGSSSIEGLFDNVILWRRALTPQDVLAVYTSENTGGEFYVHVASVSTSGGNVTVSWTGGQGPYVVERKAALTDATWTTVATTSSLSATFPSGGGVGFYRVRSAQ
ncbi:MAG TPA: LamG domain-containing protein, partial [Candidatus Saccharimonadales bacterium]|nr:LamG domain-containing protein [Candidatus Saccharimonadales bacterium]